MHHKCGIAVGVVVVIVIAAVIFGIASFNLSALPDPGRFETSVATHAKAWYIGRAARMSAHPALPNNAASVAAGSALFSMDCASCHGEDGRKPTPVGKSMYPRAVDLSSPQVQQMSDPEIFWVIKNGVRLSGMPGFARINSDDEIWQLAYYVRSLGKDGRVAHASVSPGFTH